MKNAVAATVLLAAIGAVYSALRAQPAVTRSVWDGVYTEEQAKHGQQLYTQRCERCHGDSLDGGEDAAPLAGDDFFADWNNLTLGDLFERIRTTMPQDQPQSLSREAIANILAFLLSYNKFPAGQTELPNQFEVLKQIRIESERPKKD